MPARGKTLGSSQIFSDHVSGPWHMHGLLDSPAYTISLKFFYSLYIPFPRCFLPMDFGLFTAHYDFYPLL